LQTVENEHPLPIPDNGNIQGIAANRTERQKTHIGNNCVVGAHALVTENKSFPEGSLIIGAPAKVARQLSDEEIAAVRWSADHYVKNAARYLCELTPL